MVNNLKHRLKQGWNVTRLIRLGLAIVVIVEAFKSSELIFGLLGGLLLFQAAFNYGCWGTSGCDINHISGESSCCGKRQKISPLKKLNKA